MAEQKRLAYAIVRFLHEQLRGGGMSPDAQESLEGRWGGVPLPPAPPSCPGLALGEIRGSVLAPCPLWPLPPAPSCPRCRDSLRVWKFFSVGR